MLLNLQQAIDNPFACEEYQLSNWLCMLSEYLERDTDMDVKYTSLDGRRECPSCKAKMALGVKNFCDKCGHKIKIGGKP